MLYVRQYAKERRLNPEETIVPDRKAIPTKMATVAETNRGLASQELARRGLDDRLDRLESRFRGQQKKDVATRGVVALAISGGLSAIGAFQAANQPSGSALANWASQGVTKMAAVVSATQLATSGAKLAINGRYIAVVLVSPRTPSPSYKSVCLLLGG